MNLALRKIVTALVLLLSVSVASGQVGTGIYNYGTFDSKGFDTINVGNLNVHFSVPVVSKTGRGGFDFKYDLAYDGSIWTPVVSGSTQVWLSRFREFGQRDEWKDCSSASH